MNLTFDAPTHTYRWNGAVVPSVTQCLDRLHSFAGVPFEVLEAAKERGTFVHDMTVAYDHGDLDEARMPMEFVGYLTAWKKFLAAYEPNWQRVERMGYSKLHRFAGTEDRRGTFGRVYPGATFGLDVKTSAQAHRVWGLQLAAYRQIVVEEDGLAHCLDRRATVQLHPDGRYTFLEWNDPNDWPVFQSLLNLIAWSKGNV